MWFVSVGCEIRSGMESSLDPRIRMIRDSVARNDAESTEDGRLPPSAHIVHLKGDCKTGGVFIGSKMCQWLHSWHMGEC